MSVFHYLTQRERNYTTSVCISFLSVLSFIFSLSLSLSLSPSLFFPLFARIVH